MSFKAILTDDFLNILEDGKEITQEDRDKVYLKAEEFGNVFSDSEIDNLIRRAVTIHNPRITVSELAEIIRKSKGE